MTLGGLIAWVDLLEVLYIHVRDLHMSPFGYSVPGHRVRRERGDENIYAWFDQSRASFPASIVYDLKKFASSMV